jgi:hypothetical protein
MYGFIGANARLRFGGPTLTAQLKVRISMNKEIRTKMEEIVRRAAEQLIAQLQSKFPTAPPQVSGEVRVEQDRPYNSYYATVATLQERQLLVQVWYDATLDGQKPGF